MKCRDKEYRVATLTDRATEAMEIAGVTNVPSDQNEDLNLPDFDTKMNVSMNSSK